ncbi:ArfGap-domain-containing protein [Hysterangium stoloniferum]|nr:ArfGap-domain-containing protein [Hysterangium stoloniferum]
MSRQEKVVSERHTRTLRELVKQPENKVCADCKRNDPRWASWNLGVFLCIRCSGIHRSMGTHISKVKSVDLDIWTPEQMESVQSWGNARANLYWEAHLKAGHIPPEHKMESFIRSKYESRRWALEGPPPRDPSVLENASERNSEPVPQPAEQPAAQSRPTTQPIAAPPAQRQPHNLLSSQARSAVQTANSPSATSIPVSSPKDDLFSLDFHSPHAATSSNPTTLTGGQKNVKNDILSLFATTPAPGTGVLGSIGGGFGATQAQAGPQIQTSMVGNSGTGMWGVQSGWTGQPASPQPQGNIWAQPQSQQSMQSNVWGQPPQSQQQQQQQQFGFGGGALTGNSQDPWGGGASQAAPDLFSSPFGSTQPAKKDDAFGDLWGGFK